MTATRFRLTRTGPRGVNALAIIGYSAGAGVVLVVLAYRDLDGDLHGMSAWPATGQALRLYTEGRTA